MIACKTAVRSKRGRINPRPAPARAGPRLRRLTRIVPGLRTGAEGVQYNQDRVNWIMAGSSGAGRRVPGVTGCGRRSRLGRSRATSRAATDQRLLLLAKERGDQPTFGLHFAVPRSAVRAVRRRSKILFQWGRVEVTSRTPRGGRGHGGPGCRRGAYLRPRAQTRGVLMDEWQPICRHWMRPPTARSGS
jgi:hypothetical protein